MSLIRDSIETMLQFEYKVSIANIFEFFGSKMPQTLFTHIKQYLSQLSIKRLTVLGFVLVITPLFASLFYIAEQGKTFSSKGAQAILEVSAIVEANRTLNQALTRAERYASQYIVLKENELLDRFTVEHFKITNIIDKQFVQHGDNKLGEQLDILTIQISQLAEQLPRLPEQLNELAEIEQLFREINTTSQAIRQQSDTLIQQQAHSIRSQANTVDDLVLKTLLIVPVTIIIAVLFIYLITHPLKALTSQIQTLQQSKFDQKITSTGSSEVQEIANALDIMRTRLQALELQKSSFIRHISHELKTPLAAIREGSALLNDDSVGTLNDGQREISQIIVQSVNRLQLLIEDLLAFNIVLDSTSLQDSEKISTNELIAEVVNQHKLELSRKQITLSQPQHAVSINSNKKQLSVIIENLLSNAIKYVPEQGNIAIDTQLVDGQLVLSVKDNGIGIEKAELAQIFDAFYQGQTPIDANIKSSGLGLTIVNELIMRLNGSITVSSNAETANNAKENNSTTGKPVTGTTFTVTLPRAYQQDV